MARQGKRVQSIRQTLKGYTIAHRQRYRLGEVPKWVIHLENGTAYIDTEHGRYWLRPGYTILYDVNWTPIDVERTGG